LSDKGLYPIIPIKDVLNLLGTNLAFYAALPLAQGLLNQWQPVLIGRRKQVLKHKITLF
jgi:hypothetical protein